MSSFIELAPWIGAALGFAFLCAALRAARRKRLVDDLPASKTTGVFIGLVDVTGTAESEQPLKSYLAEQACVHYQWAVDERWTRTVVETYTDDKGRTQTRTRRETGWTQIGSGAQMQAFYLKDDCGVVRVIPDGAKLEPQTVFEQTCTPLDGLYYGKGPAGAVAHSDFIRRFVEEAIVLHAPLYVMGQAREREDVVAPEIAADKRSPMFLISTRSREQISKGFGWAEWGWGVGGLALSVAGFLIHDQGKGGLPNIGVYASVGGAYLCMAGLFWIWMVYNSIVDLRQRVRQGWSQVDIQLKRRHDLIPNLVQTIQGLRDYERNLQTEVALLRGQMEATPPGQPGPDFQSCGRVLVAMAERYPELKAQVSFLNLQKNLSNTEQRIALARGYFNSIATFYNIRLQIIPDRFIAALAGLKEESLMGANEFERAPVEVTFAQAPPTLPAA